PDWHADAELRRSVHASIFRRGHSRIDRASDFFGTQCLRARRLASAIEYHTDAGRPVRPAADDEAACEESVATAYRRWVGHEQARHRSTRPRATAWRGMDPAPR